MAIQLFDYVKLVFSRDNKSWKELSDMDKSRNFFMLSRFCAIKFPEQVHALSLLRINPVAVSDYWHRTLSSLHGTVPNWIYAKTKKKDEETKKMNLPSDDFIVWYCQKNEMSKREFTENIKFFGEEFLKEMRSFEKVLKSQGVI